MAKIDIERGYSYQKGRPRPVYIKLIGDNEELKAFISIVPRFEKPPYTDTFRVEIHKGDIISPDVDIRLNL